MTAWDAEKFFTEYFENAVSVEVHTEAGMETRLMTLLEFLDRDADGELTLAINPERPSITVHNGLDIQLTQQQIQEIRKVFLLKFR